MQLGELIAKFEDEVSAAEAVRSLPDGVLTERVSVAAASEDLTPGEFAVRSVEQFVAHASDEEWHALVGQLTAARDPGLAFLRRALNNALAVAA